MHKEIIFKYNVGAVEVSIVRYHDGSYQYRVNDELIGKYTELIREHLEEILLALPEKSVSELYDIVNIAQEILRVNDEDKSLVAYAVMRELKYKKLQVLIDDPYVEDISIVGTGSIWVRHSLLTSMDPTVDYIRTNIIIEDEDELLFYMNLLAERSGKIISKATPILDFNLPEADGGHRVHAVLPEIAGGSGEIVIRKKKESSKLRLKDLVRNGMLNESIARFINYIIVNRGSILIVGPPGSGKTTLLRAIIYDLIPKSWKIAIIEDTPEIDPPRNSSWVRYVVPISPWGSRDEIDQMVLAKAALRSSVSRFLVIGETRGSEAKVLVQAMNMGLGGLTTFHGGSAEEAIMRLTSPPINLAPSQVAMFWVIITVNYVINNGIKRAIVSIDEPIYSREDDDIILNNIYSYGEDISLDELIRRSKRVKARLKVPREVILGNAS